MEKAFRQIVTHARLPAGTHLLLALSGGVDSVVLLRLLLSVLPDFDLRLTAWHLDHQIRSESAEDAAFVRDLCASLEIPCVCDSVDVSRLATESGLGLEATAREVRRERLREYAEAHGCTRILLAHHQDDQAETFLLRLLRGSGTTGLQAMQPINGPFWRPLLEFTRSEIRAYAEAQGFRWVEDESNRDTRFMRNRIRHDLLPLLSEYNPKVSRRLAALCRQLQDEQSFWQEQVALAWPQVLCSADDGLRLDRDRLLKQHPALRSRLLREALSRLRGDLHGYEQVHIGQLEGLLEGTRPQASVDLPGVWAARRYGELWLRCSAPVSEPFRLEFDVGTALELPDGRSLRSELVGNSLGEGPDRVEFDFDQLPESIAVRTPAPGDRFVPSGMRGRQKIKDFFIDQKIAAEQRRTMPLLVSGGDILWIVGSRRSSLAPVRSTTRKILAVQLG